MFQNKSNSTENNPVIFRDQLVTVGDLETFRITLLAEIKLLLQESPLPPTKQWLRSAEVRKILGISAGTLQNLRVTGTLSNTKIGGIMFYRYDDITRLLNNQNPK